MITQLLGIVPCGQQLSDSVPGRQNTAEQRRLPPGTVLPCRAVSSGFWDDFGTFPKIVLGTYSGDSPSYLGYVGQCKGYPSLGKTLLSYGSCSFLEAQGHALVEHSAMDHGIMEPSSCPEGFEADTFFNGRGGGGGEGRGVPVIGGIGLNRTQLQPLVLLDRSRIVFGII